MLKRQVGGIPIVVHSHSGRIVVSKKFGHITVSFHLVKICPVVLTHPRVVDVDSRRHGLHVNCLQNIMADRHMLKEREVVSGCAVKRRTK